MSEDRARKSLVLARALCALAVLLALWTATRAAWPADAATIDHGSSAARGVLAVNDASLPDADLARTIALAPFSPARMPPEEPYRIERATPPPVTAAAPVRQVVALLGTVVSASGPSFAMCQIAGSPPRLVYPGQRIGAMTLDSVFQGRASFTDQDGVRVVLRVPTAGSGAR